MNTLNWFQIICMILSDVPTARVDGIIFHARSFNGDDDGLFELISKLVGSDVARAVMINGGTGEGHGDPTIRAWPGKDEYIKKLLKVSGCEIHLATPGTHTLSEGFAFSEKAQELGWKSVVVVAQPFQLPRIMCTHLHVMRSRNYPMRVYAAAPAEVSWKKVTNGNQGKPGMSRFDQIQAEFERLSAYHAQGNLASMEELLGYLCDGRDLVQ